MTLSPQLLPGPVSPNFTQITCTHDGKPQYPSYFILLPFLFRLPRKPRKPSTLPAKTHRFVLSVVSDYARLRREPHYPRKKTTLKSLSCILPPFSVRHGIFGGPFTTPTQHSTPTLRLAGFLLDDGAGGWPKSILGMTDSLPHFGFGGMFLLGDEFFPLLY